MGLITPENAGIGGRAAWVCGRLLAGNAGSNTA